MKLLIIARFFPPKQGAQQIQMWKVANALANVGIKTIVISQFASAGQQITNEEFLLCDNRNLKILYVPGTNYWNDSKKLPARLKHRLTSETDAINSYSQWTRGASSLAENIIKALKPDIMMTVSTPFESHMAGLLVRRKFNIPWIAFFSDPWPKNPPPYNSREILFFSKYKLFLLRKCFQNCDSILATNKIQIKFMQQSSGIDISSHSYIVPHIGDQSQIEINSNPRNVLTHTGFLSKERTSKALLTAIKSNAENPQIAFDGLVQVGNVSSEFLKLVNENRIMHCVKFIDVVRPNEANLLARESKVLLVIEADMEESPYLPSKFADYAMTGRSILAITPKISTVRNYLERFGGGIAVTNNELEIDKALKRLFLQNEEFCNLNLAYQFSPTTVASKYLDVFEEVIHKKQIYGN